MPRLLPIFSATAFFSLYVTGVLLIPILWFILIATILFLFILILYKKKLALGAKLLIVIFFASSFISLSDLVLRPFLSNQFYRRSIDATQIPFAPFEKLLRYKSNVNSSRLEYGDLADYTGNSEYRVFRQVTFLTDQFGFRNDISNRRVVDLILLGDSYFAGTGTSQEAAVSSLLASNFGFNVCNLSNQGSPWHEYMNFRFESNRLNTNDSTIVVWGLFLANDFDDYFGEIYHYDERIPVNILFKKWWIKLQYFRHRSAIYRLFLKVKYNLDSKAKLVKNEVLVLENDTVKPIIFYKPYIEHTNRTTNQWKQHSNYPKFYQTVEEMKNYCGSLGLKLTIVNIPSKEEVYRWLIPGSTELLFDEGHNNIFRMLTEICLELDIPFLDLFPEFSGEARDLYQKSGEYLWWSDDTHWNEKGHKLAASIIHQWIVELEADSTKQHQ